MRGFIREHNARYGPVCWFIIYAAGVRMRSEILWQRTRRMDRRSARSSVTRVVTIHVGTRGGRRGYWPVVDVCDGGLWRSDASQGGTRGA